MLNTHKPLREEEVVELLERAERLNELLSKSHKPQKNRFSELLKDLMDDRELGRPQLAQELASYKPKLDVTTELAEAEQTIARLAEPPEPKSYTITLRKGHGSDELQVITLEPGRITTEHVHLLEAGALPSADLYALIKQSLGAVKALEEEEQKDLDRTFSQKQQDAGIVSAPLPAPSGSDVITAEPGTPIESQASGTGPLVIQASESMVTIPIAGEPELPAPGLASRLGLEPKTHSEYGQPRALPTDDLARYTEAYMLVFTDLKLVPPPAEDRKENNGARTAIADRALGITGKLTFADVADRTAHQKLVRQLRPLTLEKISDDVLARVTSSSIRRRLEHLNSTIDTLQDHIFNHSRQGIDAHAALDSAKEWLRQAGITTDEQIRAINGNRTLEEMITAHEFKKDVDIPKQIERLFDKLKGRSPAIAQEYGDRIPSELSDFGKEATVLQNYYNQQYQRFDELLEQMQAQKQIGRFAAAN